MNLSTEKKLMDLQNRLMVAKREEEGKVVGLHLKWISHETLLYSTRDYI